MACEPHIGSGAMTYNLLKIIGEIEASHGKVTLLPGIVYSLSLTRSDHLLYIKLS